MQTGIDVVSPGAAGYAQVEEAVGLSHQRSVNGGSTIFYDSVAAAYNAAEVGSFLDIGRPTQNLCNIRKVLAGRGLKNAVDCELSRLTCDANGTPIPKQHRTVILKKCSDTKMRVLR